MTGVQTCALPIFGEPAYGQHVIIELRQASASRIIDVMGFDDYKVVLYRQDDGSWVAEIPAIPGCYALMPTREEALAELTNVFDMIAAAPPSAPSSPCLNRPLWQGGRCRGDGCTDSGVAVVGMGERQSATN